MASYKEYYGIRELYRPPSGEASVDIVAVHGLNGGATRTWTSKKNNACWLSDPYMLPKYIPSARVLVWGYNASFSSLTGAKPSKDRIHHHAQTMIQDLYSDRLLEDRLEKPIIFVCHSLGGIVVKRALAYSYMKRSEKISHLHSIYNCTYGILFFGTPHHGADKAAMLAIVQKLVGTTLPSKIGSFEHGLVAALEVESETLQNITDHFMPMMKRFYIHFFWEQDKTDLKCNREYIVTSESAAPALPDVERAGIPADHSSMVKFEGPTAPGFRTVVAALRKHTDEAPGIIRQRVADSKRLLAQEKEQEAFEKLRLLQPLVPPPEMALAQRHVASSIQRIEAKGRVTDYDFVVHFPQQERVV